ncbi:MAG: hypothetical protein ACRDSR_28195 [Pseudonocardiaceae bacterium]
MSHFLGGRRFEDFLDKIFGGIPVAAGEHPRPPEQGRGFSPEQLRYFVRRPVADGLEPRHDEPS